MVNGGFNISANQVNKLKEALKTLNTEKLDYASFTGNVDSIFDTINTENNIFANTGMEEILYDIAGNDKEISDEEIKAFMESNGESEFSLEAFETYAMNAIDEALNTSSTTPAIETIIEEAKDEQTPTKTDAIEMTSKASSTTGIHETSKHNFIEYGTKTLEVFEKTTTFPNGGTSVNYYNTKGNDLLAEAISEDSALAELIEDSLYEKESNYRYSDQDYHSQAIMDELTDIQDRTGCSLEDIVAKGGKDFLITLLDATGGKFDVSSANDAQYTEEFYNVISETYNEYKENGIDTPYSLDKWYSTLKEHVTNTTSSPDLFKQYARMMGDITLYDSDSTMSLMEMKESVDDFEQIYSVYNGILAKEGNLTSEEKSLVKIFENMKSNSFLPDANRSEMITLSNKFLGQDRDILADKDYEAYVLDGAFVSEMEEWSLLNKTEDEIMAKYAGDLNCNLDELSNDQKQALADIYNYDVYFSELLKSIQSISEIEEKDHVKLAEALTQGFEDLYGVNPLDIGYNIYEVLSTCSSQGIFYETLQTEYNNVGLLKDYIQNGFAIIEGKYVTDYETISTYIQNETTGNLTSSYQDVQNTVEKCNSNFEIGKATFEVVKTIAINTLKAIPQTKAIGKLADFVVTTLETSVDLRKELKNMGCDLDEVSPNALMGYAEEFFYGEKTIEEIHEEMVKNLDLDNFNIDSCCNVVYTLGQLIFCGSNNLLNPKTNQLYDVTNVIDKLTDLGKSTIDLKEAFSEEDANKFLASFKAADKGYKFTKVLVDLLDK